jgi:hypothetical protein
MTDLDLDALRAAEAKMTPGPWRTENVGYTTMFAAKSFVEPAVAAFWQHDSLDAAGIVALRNAAPALLDEVQAARERRCETCQHEKDFPQTHDRTFGCPIYSTGCMKWNLPCGAIKTCGAWAKREGT